MQSIRLAVATTLVVALSAAGCSSSTSSSTNGTNNTTCGALSSPSNPEDKACEDCMATSCKGSFSGPCGPVATCTCSCPEGDLSCLTSCGEKGGSSCNDCVARIDACESSKCASECGRTD